MPTSTHRCPTYTHNQVFGKSPSNTGQRKIYLQRARFLPIASTTPKQRSHVSTEQLGIYALVALSGMIVFRRSAAHAWTTKSSFVFLFFSMLSLFSLFWFTAVDVKYFNCIINTVELDVMHCWREKSSFRFYKSIYPCPL